MADVTDANFNDKVLQNKTPVVIDFWAPWCTPCRIVTPIIDELEKDYAGKVKVVKMNVDENPQTAGQYSVMSIPTILIVKDGKPVKSMIGAQSKDAFKRGIDEAISASS